MIIRMKLIKVAYLIQTLSKICQQGFDDARLFIQQNNLVACDQCVSTVNPVTSTAITDIDCLECETQKQVSFFLLFAFTHLIFIFSI